MRLHIWTDETSYLAVCHAESVAEARKMLEIEVGGNDGSCPGRAKAWRDISENTSAPYNGRVAAFCLSASAEVREQLAYSEKVCAERDALRAKVVELEAALAEAREDHQELDGTDAAHPAWWRGHNYGSDSICRALTEVLDGKEPSGTCGEPYETLRRRVWEALEDSKRLEWVIEQSNDGNGWLDDGVWDSAPYIEDCDDVQIIIRAAIDVAREKK